MNEWTKVVETSSPISTIDMFNLLALKNHGDLIMLLSSCAWITQMELHNESKILDLSHKIMEEFEEEILDLLLSDIKVRDNNPQFSFMKEE